MSYNTLANYYELIAAMMLQDHKFTIQEVEDMIPFEREIYVMAVNRYNTKQGESDGGYAAMVRETKRGGAG